MLWPEQPFFLGLPQRPHGSHPQPLLQLQLCMPRAHHCGSYILMGSSCHPWRGGGWGEGKQGPSALGGCPALQANRPLGLRVHGRPVAFCSAPPPPGGTGRELLLAPNKSTVMASSFCCRAHSPRPPPQHWAHQKVPTLEVEERKGLCTWMGTQSTEGLQGVTNYLSIPQSFYLLASAATSSPQ